MVDEEAEPGEGRRSSVPKLVGTHRRSWQHLAHDLYLAVLAVLVAGLVAAVVLEVFTNIQQAGSTFRPPDPGFLLGGGGGGEDVPSISLVAEQIDPSVPVLHAIAHVKLPVDWLHDENTARPWTCGFISLCPRYASRQVFLSILREVGSSEEIQTPTERQFAASANPYANGRLTYDTRPIGTAKSVTSTEGATAPITIPLVGSQARFPQDRYGTFVGLTVLIDGAEIQPPKRLASVPGALRDYVLNGISVVSDLPAGEGLVSIRPYCSTSTQLRLALRDQPCPFFTLSIERPLGYQAYVYAIAAIPLIFAFLFGHFLFFSRRYKPRPVQELIAAMVAAILAILPIRPILVPGEITGITRVDVLLALGLVANVAVIVIKYLSESWSDRMAPVESPAEETG